MNPVVSLLRWAFDRRFRRTTLILIGLLFLLVGLEASYFGGSISLTWVGTAVALSPLFFRRNITSLLVVITLGLALGQWRGQVVLNNAAPYLLLEDKKVTMQGVVQDDPTYHESGQTEFYLYKIVHNGKSLPGKMRVRGFTGATTISRGDELKVSGKIRDGFGSYQAATSYADIKILAVNQSPIEDLRRSLFAGVYTALPEPQSSLGLGFLVGLRTLLPDSLLEILSITGLTHIVAVSGYNLTVIVRLVRRFIARYSKFLTTAGCLFLIALFVSMTGLVPSIFRATVVATLSLAAWHYGRPIKPLMLLMISSGVTAMVNPYFLWVDIGWWLSFLAFFGVLIIAPLITARWFTNKPNTILQILIETFSAQLMTWPLIVATFSQMSLVSMLANLVITPLIPLAMLLTFIAGLGGVFLTELIGWFAWPARLLLKGIIDAIDLMSQIPYALVEFEMGYLQMLFIYGLIMVLTIVLWSRNRQLNRKFEQYNVLD